MKLEEKTFLVVGNNIVLNEIGEEERKDYIKLQKEDVIFAKKFETKELEDLLWDTVTNHHSFYVSIRHKSDNSFIGYCGIKNIRKDEKELVIEIRKNCQKKGYAAEALTLFMHKLHEEKEFTKFKALVDVENTASQSLCEKIGGMPSGIEAHLIKDKKFMEEYEKEYAFEITEQMKIIAKKFGVSPEKLLTHVLVYRFKMRNEWLGGNDI